MRYERQESFRGIGRDGQEKLRNACVAIVGLGALGTVCSELLCRAGIGTLLLYDFDRVDETNLQRQALYKTDDIGRLKAKASKAALIKVNPDAKIISRELKLNKDNIHEVKADVVVDCLDDLNLKLVLNDHCVRNKIPMVYGAVAESKGYLYVVKNGNNLNDIYNKDMIAETCSTRGVTNTIVGVIASMQANEAIKLVVGAETEKYLIRIDLWKNSFERLKVKQKMQLKEIPEYTIKRCKTNATFEVNPHKKLKMDFEALKDRFEVVADTPMVLILRIEGEEVVVYENGMLMFKSLKNTDKAGEIAKIIYSV